VSTGHVDQVSFTGAAQSLLHEVLRDEWGQVSLSVYETARLVALAPWLDGHSTRLEFLCRQQSPDGSWGSPDGYAFVPTLSATEALLASLRRPSDAGAINRQQVVLAAARGLHALKCWLDDSAFSVPDTIAVEIIAPGLIAQINDHLAHLATQPLLDPDDGWPRTTLLLPADIQPVPLAAIRAALGRKDVHSMKLWASLEAFHGGSEPMPFIRPEAGAVGCSPAATAVWLGGSPEDDQDARVYLQRLQARGGGPVPGVTPITFFERAWILNSLAPTGLAYTVPEPLLDSLEAGIGEYGVPAAPGLPPDADDTAGVLYALALHGRPHRPDSLMHYRGDGYFTCFPSERTPSTSTNAHVLEAFGAHLVRGPGDRRRFGPAAEMVATWLLEHQRQDGSWYDKWHASAYYATACCVLALTTFEPERSAQAVAAAVDWVLATQRADGSWGRWTGTAEETAYAVQILLRADIPARSHAVARAAAAGCWFLTASDGPTEYPGLWHAKDLYAPTAVIRGARLAALALGAAKISSLGRLAS